MPVISSSASARTPTRRAASTRRSSWRDVRRSTDASRRTISSIPGRCTFTTTRVPSLSTARWVWPIDAAASGSNSNDANACSTGSPSSDSSMSTTSSRGMGRTSDRSSDSSSVNVGGSMSLRVDAIWPNFTNIPPDSSRTVRSRRANSGDSSAADDAYRTCMRFCLRA